MASIETLEAANAAVLAELVVDPVTTDHTRVQILNMLLATDDDKNFFVTMFKEALSYGECPDCGHENHWLIPEDELSQMGWVTPEKDDRVKYNPTAEDCPLYQEACPKKKVNY
jgi:hypothetical protein